MSSTLFELSQLRCFVVVAEELHFMRAATRLNMTQPPLSRQIQMLERVLGARLFDRNSRSVRLTPAGRSFLPEAVRILQLVESSAATARLVARGEKGKVTLGFTAAAGYELLPRLIRRTREALPNVELVLREMVSGEQVEALLTRRIDIGLLRPPIVREEFVSWPIMSESLMAAMHEDDPMLREAPLPLKIFDQRDLIMYSPEGSRYFYDLLRTLFSASGVVPHYVQHLSQIHSMLALVSGGLGTALVPRAAMGLRFVGVGFAAVVTRPASPVELHVAARQDCDNPLAGQVSALWRTMLTVA